MLAEGSRYIRNKIRIQKLKRIIKSELKSIVFQVDDKISILNQAIKNLDKRLILRTESVRMITIVYDKYIDELYEHLNLQQRNCLHVIYDKIRVGEKNMDRYEDDIKDMIKEGIVKDPYSFWKGRLTDLIAFLKPLPLVVVR